MEAVNQLAIYLEEASELGIGHIRVRWFSPAVGSGDFKMQTPFSAALLGGLYVRPP